MTREHYDAQLKELDEALLEMGELVASTISASVATLDRRDVVEADRLIQADNLIDERRYRIERQALLLIATQQPLASDLRTVAAILTIATELERIGDYCEGIAKLTLRMAGDPVIASVTDIDMMAELTPRLLREALQAYRDRNVEIAGEVWMRDDEVDELYENVYRRLVSSMIEDPSTVRQGTYLLWVAHNLERMADRVTNIAERVAFVVTGEIGDFRARLEAQTLPK